MDRPGILQKCVVVVDDTGTTGSNLVLDVQKNSGSGWATILNSTITVTVNTGSDQIVTTADFSDFTISEGDLLRIVCTSAPDDAYGCMCKLYVV